MEVLRVCEVVIVRNHLDIDVVCYKMWRNAIHPGVRCLSDFLTGWIQRLVDVRRKGTQLPELHECRP